MSKTTKMLKSPEKSKVFSTWEINENLEGDYYVVTLRIQGNIYYQAKDVDITDAYRQVLRHVATPLSRSVTIARLFGGEL